MLTKAMLAFYLFNGALQFVHVAFKEREMGEKEILKATVLLRIGRQHEDDPNGDLLLPRHAEAWSRTFIRHVEALFYRPAQDKAHTESALDEKSTVRINPSHFKSYNFKYARNIFNASSFYLVQNSSKTFTELANFIVSGS